MSKIGRLLCAAPIVIVAMPAHANSWSEAPQPQADGALAAKQEAGKEVTTVSSAQDRPVKGTEVFDEIVVTGTKRSKAEAVQDVALAVTAFDARALDALNLTDISSLRA